ncbi:MAG: mechanosensitive ion channel family protein, partial [Alphaproteobacteria bacterium]|nr:mechanosensitive ion channel family protein [Alphaproteobacteria bacterium]
MTWIHSISTWVPAWVVGVVTIIVPAMIVLAASRWIIHRLMRLAGRYSPFLQRLLARSQGPVSLILVTVVSGIALAGARFPWEVTAAIGRVLAVVFVVAIGWAASIALDIGVEIYLR